VSHTSARSSSLTAKPKSMRMRSSTTVVLYSLYSIKSQAKDSKKAKIEQGEFNEKLSK
jgi:hypothetical protein